jgi:hypothetical protein
MQLISGQRTGGRQWRCIVVRSKPNDSFPEARARIVSHRLPRCQNQPGRMYQLTLTWCFTHQISTRLVSGLPRHTVQAEWCFMKFGYYFLNNEGVLRPSLAVARICPGYPTIVNAGQ